MMNLQSEKRAGQPSPAVQSAMETLSTEIAGLAELHDSLSGPLGESVQEAVAAIANVKGRLVVSGIGKSGHIARKLAATLASTGTPSMFMHPSEASHGDLGMLTLDDAVLAMSWSGETRELADITSYTRRYKIPLLSVTANGDSTLAKASDIALVLPKVVEACPHGLAPTTSTLLQLALGDAIAVALLRHRGFTPADFREFHPGGKLGTALLTVGDIMRQPPQLALVRPETPMSAVILEMTTKAIGCAVVLGDGDGIVGIITDGDLRRHMNESITARQAQDIMTRKPLKIAPRTLASAALATMAERRILVLVSEEEGRLAGVLTMADLLARGVS